MKRKRTGKRKMSKTVYLYDTTLRDGTQAEGINFSRADKVRIAQALDALGVHYIEGGWPGSNPKDMGFFHDIRAVRLTQAKVVAFGSTRRAGRPVEQDDNVVTLVKAKTPAIAVFGKSWLLHVRDVLGAAPEENLRMIADTVSYLKSRGVELIYDAEHFFDGFQDDPDYALSTLQAAEEAGADFLVLCDTNGGTLPSDVREITAVVKGKRRIPLGIHAHNDSGLGVAVSLAAVQAGAEMVQGTINGYGERCGNANLVTIIPNLVLKMGIECVGKKQLSRLEETSRFVDELANVRSDTRNPFVGASAFAHKGGMHVDAVRKNPRTFEQHIDPARVGNRRRILVSELSGKSNVVLKAIEFGLDLGKDTPQTREILSELKRLGEEGYEFEGADASFQILMQKALGRHKNFFELEGFRVIVEKRKEGKPISEATIKVRVSGQGTEHTAAEGDGPVHALDNALRKALQPFYPQIAKVHLADFKVRVLDAAAGAAAKVRVLMESKDEEGEIWGTVGVSENIIEASWQALVDSVDYKLFKDRETPPRQDKK
ncbi:MAG: citramalate synthase [Candidatus Aureabacteria bacterium]|nr:citramalate synthase [Candidatus Auribacterota bacterium]